MKTYKYDLEITQGNDRSFGFSFVYGPGTVTDWSGYTFRLWLRRYFENLTPELELLSSAGEITWETPNVMIKFPKTKTALLDGSYLYDLEATSSGGYRVTPIAGVVHIKSAVTTPI